MKTLIISALVLTSLSTFAQNAGSGPGNNTNNLTELYTCNSDKGTIVIQEDSKEISINFYKHEANNFGYYGVLFIGSGVSDRDEPEAADWQGVNAIVVIDKTVAKNGSDLSDNNKLNYTNTKNTLSLKGANSADFSYFRGGFSLNKKSLKLKITYQEFVWMMPAFRLTDKLSCTKTEI